MFIDNIVNPIAQIIITSVQYEQYVADDIDSKVSDFWGIMKNLAEYLNPVTLLDDIEEWIQEEIFSLNLRYIVNDSCDYFKWLCHKDLGIYGKETPENLIDFMVSSMKQ